MTAPKNIEQEAKPKMSMIPFDLLRDFLIPAYEEGVIKYYRESWRKGFKISDMFDSLQRHSTQFFHNLEDDDKEALERFNIKKHHLGAMLFAVLCMCDTITNHPELDDREAIMKGLVDEIKEG